MAVKASRIGELVAEALDRVLFVARVHRVTRLQFGSLVIDLADEHDADETPEQARARKAARERELLFRSAGR